MILYSTVSEEELLPYFKKWEEGVNSRPGFSKESLNLMLLSRETRSAIDLTGLNFILYMLNALTFLIVSSFLELVPLVFSIPGITCFLSNRICQDLLEKYFGMQTGWEN